MSIFKKLFLFLFAPVFLWSSPLIIGYYPDWGKWMSPAYTYADVPYEKLTHVLWSFISPDSLGNLRGNAVDDPTELDSMVSLAHNVGTKVIISLGGAGSCEYFANVAANDSLRANFVNNLMEFVNDHDLDGIDMDWEYSSVPVPDADTTAYNKLLVDIRAVLPTTKTLSAAIPCSGYYGKYFTVSAMNEVLDWFGFMTYDITGYWDELARYNSPLYPNGNRTTWSWQETAKYWKNRGVPTEKMVFGIAFFGFEFDMATGPASTFNGNATYLGYNEIVSNTDWEFYYDSTAQVPYAICPGSSYTTFDDPYSAQVKSKWVLDNEYAGVMIWELSLDVMPDMSQPMVSAIYETMSGSGITKLNSFAKQSFPFAYFQNQLIYNALSNQKQMLPVTIHSISGKQITTFTLESGKAFTLPPLRAGTYFAVSSVGQIKITIP